jgi:hypothetical protein
MKRIVIFLLLGLATAFAACSNSGTEGKLKDNQPPTVWLSAGPPEGSTSTYRIQLFWGGFDPDGEIKGYEYLVTNNNGTLNPADTIGQPWLPLAGNDSTFTFSADQEVDTLNTTRLVSQFARSHTFFIRAIDREGLRSRQPAYRSFTSTTLSPDVKVDVPVRHFFDAAEVPAISTFRWRATDYINDLVLKQEPDSVQWALTHVPDGQSYEQTMAYLRTSAADKEWLPWVWYKAPQDSGKFWTTPVIDNGRYVFAIRAKDEAGAITPVLDEERNLRRVHVGQLTSGPQMTVTNDYIGVIRTTACNGAASILDSPSGVPLIFKLTASADSYGGTIAGYRYGWDIPDLDDPEQWEVDLTPLPCPTCLVTLPARTFFFGTHTLTMEVVDNSGYCSRVEVKVNIVPFTLERNLLVVDDDANDEGATFGWNNGGSGPNDQEHDAFWLDMASEVAGFDSQIDMIDTKLGFIPLATLAQYKSIIWNVYGDNTRSSPSAVQPLLYKYIAYRPKNPTTGIATGKVLPNVLALTMAAGGHIMICGRQPVQLVISRTATVGVRYPLIFLYEMDGKQGPATGPDITSTVGDQSFAYRELCLETIDFSIMNTSIVRKGSKVYCRTEFTRPHGDGSTTTRDDSMREAVPIDLNFPAVGLRPEAAGPGQWYEPSHFGLDAEVYNPAYFRKGGICDYVPVNPRSCFQPIYGLECFDTLEPTYHQPIAFWTSAYADHVADVGGAVGARSVVFGFDPAFLTPDEFRPGMDYILFNEWKLPRIGNLRAASSP